MKHYDLLPSLIQSAAHFLEKQKTAGPFEKVLLRFFKNHFAKIETGKIPGAAFIPLQTAVLSIAENESSKQALEFFDYISWLESKIENKPFAEIVRGKYSEK